MPRSATLGSHVQAATSQSGWELDGVGDRETIHTLTPDQLHLRNMASGFVADAAQIEVARRFTDLRARLLAAKPPTAVQRRFPRLRGRRVKPVRGVYLWGDVGRGKTYMMDLFYESLPFDAKLRLHFHRFMGRVHEDLRSLADRADPLLAVAERFAREARVLCFDEFHVADIGDAMILGGLLRGLFDRGVTLVATSNTPPERLYENGLQRRRFLPAIELLKARTDIVFANGREDYRQRVLRRNGIYVTGAEAETALRASFRALARAAVARRRVLRVNGRPIVARYWAEDVVWFEFAALCEGPRNNDDYVELARLFTTVALHRVPIFDRSKEDAARRFIGLVDEFYDRGVKLLLAADAPLERLYQGRLLAAEFERAKSRLREMQSDDYLGRPHRP